MHVRKILVAGGLGLVGCVLAAGSAQAACVAKGAAQADDLALTCSGGSVDAKYSPGFGAFSKEVRVSGSGTINNCKAPGKPAIASGQVTLEGTGNGNCVNGWQGSGTITVQWNTGEQTSASFTGASSSGPVIFHAKVGTGLFSGREAYLEGKDTSTTISSLFSCAGGTIGLSGYDHGSFQIVSVAIAGDCQKRLVPPCSVLRGRPAACRPHHG